jgi:hypothetical protein
MEWDPTPIKTGCPCPAVVGPYPVTVGIRPPSIPVYSGQPDISVWRVINPISIRRKIIIEISGVPIIHVIIRFFIISLIPIGIFIIGNRDINQAA